MTRGEEDGGRIPVFLLTGFLGAGKTTLLNRMLQDPALRDTALVINEFGLTAVDHHLVRAGREQTLVASAGCLCCVAGSDLRGSLDELLTLRRQGAAPPFSRVIVETTGLADPAPIVNSLIPGGARAMGLRDHVVARAFRLSSAVVAANPESLGAALERHPESLRQIAFADHAVLTHTDRTPSGDWPARLKAINPGLRIHDSSAADFDPAALLRPGGYAAFGKGEGVAEWLAFEAARTPRAAGSAQDLNRHGAVRAIALTHAAPLEPAALQRFLAGLTLAGGGLLRLKGLAALTDDPDSPAVVHAVRHRLYPLLRLPAWPDARRDTRLVAIGESLEEAAVRRAFAAALA